MNKLEIEVGEELGKFESHAQWVNTAPQVYLKAYRKIGNRDVITLDSSTPRRVMLRGLQFNNARDESTFPVVVYAISRTAMAS